MMVVDQNLLNFWKLFLLANRILRIEKSEFAKKKM